MLHTKLVGVTSPVLEILQIFKFGQISLSDHGGQKIESAQKIHAGRG